MYYYHLTYFLKQSDCINPATKISESRYHQYVSTVQFIKLTKTFIQSNYNTFLVDKAIEVATIAEKKIITS